MMVAAAEHGTGMVLRQVKVEEKSNEIPAVREISGSLDITGRIVAMDAMHAQHETAHILGRDQRRKCSQTVPHRSEGVARTENEGRALHFSLEVGPIIP